MCLIKIFKKIEKTKVIVFSMNKGIEEPKFAIGDAQLERVNLGKMFTSDEWMEK